MITPTVPPLPVYVAGPFAAMSWHGIFANTDRAKRLAQYLSAYGYAPVCIHPVIDPAADRDPDARIRGLGQAVALVQMVARAGGYLAIIERDDGTLSHGTALEVDAWREVADLRGRSWRADWSTWDTMIRGGVR